MEKIAFKLFLNPGQADEYKKRHDQIWPEMVSLLKAAGVSDYSIYLDEQTHSLFAVLWRTNNHKMDDLPNHPVMQKWWAHMSDIMQREKNGGPVIVHLKTMFHLD